MAWVLGVSIFFISTLGQELSFSLAGDRTFQVRRNGVLWLQGHKYRVHKQDALLCSESGTLEPLGSPRQIAGSDPLGNYTETSLKWASAGSYIWKTSFRTYSSDASVLVFSHHFPKGYGHIATNAALVAEFPVFEKSKGALPHLHWLSFGGLFAQLRRSENVNAFPLVHGAYKPGATDTPLVLYDPKGPKHQVLILSQLDHHKAGRVSSDDTSIKMGIKNVTSIPKGWDQSFILVAGTGITSGLHRWGRRLLQYGRKAPTNIWKGKVASTIGYWTDNGAFYHYAGVPKNSTYEEVLIDVRKSHMQLSIPFGHWQFDSWFYPKDGPVGPGGGGGCVVNWTSIPGVFPRGMKYIQSAIQLPMIMHNRVWSPKSDYLKNLGFEWWTSETPCSAMPKNPLAFFKWFFAQQNGWGLDMYEQDWMCDQYDHLPEMQSNISLADLWLEGMAKGAESAGISIQYCMPYPADLLASTRHPAVTQARASDDYRAGNDQWKIGPTALLHYSLGIMPFKDTFYSTSGLEIGGQYEKSIESCPDRQALIAALSTAEVAPGDGKGYLNVTRIMQTCNAQGLVLKPDKPCTTIDHCLATDCFQEVYHTYTNHHAGLVVNYVFAEGDVRDKSGWRLDPLQLHLPEGQQYISFNWYNGHISRVVAATSGPDSSVTMEAGFEGHSYYILSPVLSNGWAFIGDTSKFVTASKARFPIVKLVDAGLEVHITGAMGEQVNGCAVKAMDLSLVCVNVQIDSSGTNRVTHFHAE